MRRESSPVLSCVLAAALLCMGTTFIVKENGVEVGRYQDTDGRDEIRVIENNVARAAAGTANSADRPKPVTVQPKTPVRQTLSVFLKWYLGILAASVAAAFLAWKRKRS